MSTPRGQRLWGSSDVPSSESVIGTRTEDGSQVLIPKVSAAQKFASRAVVGSSVPTSVTIAHVEEQSTMPLTRGPVTGVRGAIFSNAPRPTPTFGAPVGSAPRSASLSTTLVAGRGTRPHETGRDALKRLGILGASATSAPVSTSLPTSAPTTGSETLAVPATIPMPAATPVPYASVASPRDVQPPVHGSMIHARSSAGSRILSALKSNNTSLVSGTPRKPETVVCGTPMPTDATLKPRSLPTVAPSYAATGVETLSVAKGDVTPVQRGDLWGDNDDDPMFSPKKQTCVSTQKDPTKNVIVDTDLSCPVSKQRFTLELFDTYCVPKRIEDVAGNSNPRTTLLEWVRNPNRATVVFMTGARGVGTSLLARLAVEQAGFVPELITIENVQDILSSTGSDGLDRYTKTLADVVRALCSAGKCVGRVLKAIIFENYETLSEVLSHVTNVKPYDGMTEVLKFVAKYCSIPVIFAGINRADQKSKSLMDSMKGTSAITLWMETLSDSTMRQWLGLHLGKLYTATGLEPLSSDIVETSIRTSNGDMSYLMTMLCWELSTRSSDLVAAPEDANKKKSALTCAQKDRSLSIFDLAERMLYDGRMTPFERTDMLHAHSDQTFIVNLMVFEEATTAFTRRGTGQSVVPPSTLAKYKGKNVSTKALTDAQTMQDISEMMECFSIADVSGSEFTKSYMSANALPTFGPTVGKTFNRQRVDFPKTLAEQSKTTKNARLLQSIDCALYQPSDKKPWCWQRGPPEDTCMALDLLHDYMMVADKCDPKCQGVVVSNDNSFREDVAQTSVSLTNSLMNHLLDVYASEDDVTTLCTPLMQFKLKNPRQNCVGRQFGQSVGKGLRKAFLENHAGAQMRRVSQQEEKTRISKARAKKRTASARDDAHPESTAGEKNRTADSVVETGAQKRRCDIDGNPVRQESPLGEAQDSNTPEEDEAKFAPAVGMARFMVSARKR